MKDEEIVEEIHYKILDEDNTIASVSQLKKGIIEGIKAGRKQLAEEISEIKEKLKKEADDK